MTDPVSSPKQGNKPMRVLRFMVHHILGVEECSVDMEGHHLFLVGGTNESGKTSALQALRMVLCGRRGMEYPDIALKEGETSGMVEIDLSGDGDLHDQLGFKVQLRLNKRRGGKVVEELVLTDSTGDPAPEPRELLKSLFDFKGFDPLAFNRAKPKEQVEIVRKMLGFDFTAMDAKRAKAYEERTGVNRDLKNAESRRSAIKVPPGTPAEKVSIVTLVAEKEQAVRHNRDVDQLAKDYQRETDEMVKLAEAKAKLLEQLAKIEAAQIEQAAKAKGLEEQVKTAEKQDVSVIQSRIEQADSINAAVDLKVQATALDQEIRKLTVAADKLTTTIEKIDADKQSTLESAKWPMEGMSMDESGILVNGLPLEQVNTANRTILSTLIGMQLNPKLRLLICENGNDLDTESLKALERICKERDFQMLLEFVTRSPQDEEMCAVVFEDGHLKDMEAVTEEVATA